LVYSRVYLVGNQAAAAAFCCERTQWEKNHANKTFSKLGPGGQLADDNDVLEFGSSNKRNQPQKRFHHR
jgi:hypothetical protein